MLSHDETAQRLGVSGLMLQTINALTETGVTYRASEVLNIAPNTLRMRLARIRRNLGVRNNVCLCLLVDRVQRGMTNSEAMKGLS